MPDQKLESHLHSDDELVKIVCERMNQKYAGEIEGPYRIGRFSVARVWTFADGEYHAHHVVSKGNDVEVYDNFEPFASWIDAKLYREGTGEYIRYGVATIVILVCLAVMANAEYQGDNFQWATAGLTMILGGAGGFLFGTRFFRR